MTRRWVIGTIVGVIVLGGASPFVPWSGLYEWMARSAWREPPHGAIIVAEPTVYTRERLVNDRFQQDHWLQKRLENTDAMEEKGLFDTVQSLSSTRSRSEVGSAVTVQVGSGSAAKSADAGQGTPLPQDGAGNVPSSQPDKIALGVSPIDRFHDLNAYRDEVRQELMRTELDDSHDIEGNTLVRLDFNVSVVPTVRDTDSALVVVNAHQVKSPKKDNSSEEDSQRAIYEEWRSYLQSLYDQSADNLVKEAQQLGHDPSPSSLKALADFKKFLSDDILNTLEIKEAAALHEIPFPDAWAQSCVDQIDAYPHPIHTHPDAPKSPAQNQHHCLAFALYRYIINYMVGQKESDRALGFAVQINEFKNKNNNVALERLVSSQPISIENLLPRGAPSQDNAKEKNIDPRLQATDPKLQATKVAGTGDTTFVPTLTGEGRNLFSTLPAICRQQRQDTEINSVGPSVITVSMTPYGDLPCPPPSDEFRDTLDSEILLFNALQTSLTRDERRIDDGIKSVALYMLDDLYCGRQYNMIGCGDEHQPKSDRGAMRPDEFLSGLYAVEPQVRRAVAFFQKDAMVSDGNERQASTRLNNYFKVTVEDCGINHCRVVLSPDMLKGFGALKDELNKGARVFTYAVNPWQVAEHVEMRSENSALLQLLGEGRLGLSAKDADFSTALKYLHENVQNQEALSHYPLVVGFGGGGSAIADESSTGLSASNSLSTEADQRSNLPTETTFGWIIRPPAGSRQIPVEHTVSATISLPSWWRMVELDVKRCWLPESDLHRLLNLTAEKRDAIDQDHLGQFCTDTRTDKRLFIKLPFAVTEIARKLGFSVIDEPYTAQSPAFQNQSLEVGRPGKIILEGGRLWRSTVVTLGTQPADEIKVTPHMQAIIASFDCVLPPRDWPRDIPLAVSNGVSDYLSLATSTGVSGMPDSPEKRWFANAVVWTSEGRTEPVPVSLYPFRTLKFPNNSPGEKGQTEVLSEYPCWDPHYKPNNGQASSGTGPQ